MNYEFKLATDGLSNSKKISVNSKRLAFLVPNMFSRLSKGFAKKTKDFVSDSGENIAKVKTLVSSSAFNEAKEDAIEAAEEIKQEQVAEIQNKIDAATEKREEVRNNDNLPVREALYIIKAYQSDIEKLISKKAKVSKAPRRLLISTLFVQKLVENRKKHMVNDAVEQQPEEVSITNGKEKAMKEYIELNNARLDYIEQINKIQAKMKQLVIDNELTKDMFEEGKAR